MAKLHTNQFEKTTLNEMNAVSLMKRFDTKYLLHQEQLSEILLSVSDSYKILEIDGQRIMPYATLYFDTAKKLCFQDHQKGKVNRFKVRMRKYLVSDLCFLEIKKKNSQGLTTKSRIKIDDFEQRLSQESETFIADNNIDHLDLLPSLTNNFSRITLVNKFLAERVTVDIGLTFQHDNVLRELQNIAIIEVKQEGKRRNTAIIAALKALTVRPTTFSKYCVGVSGIYPAIKSNRFKEINLKISKLTA